MLKDQYEWPPGPGLLKVLVFQRGHSVASIARGFEKSDAQTGKLFTKYRILIRRNWVTPEFKQLAQQYIQKF